MPSDTITLVLTGESIPLDLFAQALLNFQRLADALSREVGDGQPIDWIVSDLQTSSAVATAQGISPDVDHIERATRAYSSVGRALQHHEPIPYSRTIRTYAEGITGVLNGRVSAAVFQTADDDWQVVSPAVKPGGAPTPRAQYGAIEGRIQTLTSRTGFRFTLFDLIHDKAVSCYLQRGQEDEMRGLWDKRVAVSGLVTRDSLTGRPLAIRRITSITTLPEREAGQYRRARGIVPLRPDDELPEVTIRRERDDA